MHYEHALTCQHTGWITSSIGLSSDRMTKECNTSKSIRHKRLKVRTVCKSSTHKYNEKNYKQLNSNHYIIESS